jgi:hypothetical protein
MNCYAACGVLACLISSRTINLVQVMSRKHYGRNIACSTGPAKCLFWFPSQVENWIQQLPGIGLMVYVTVWWTCFLRNDLDTVCWFRLNFSHVTRSVAWLFKQLFIYKISVSYKIDRLCDLVDRVLGYRSGGPGSIPGTTRKKSSGSWTGSTQPREYNWGAMW